MFKKMLIAAVAVSVAACSPSPYQQGYQGQDVASQAVQQGGSFVEEHPYLTAGAAAAGAYALANRNNRRNNGYYDRGYGRTRVIHRTVIRRPSGYSSYSRPAYRTVTRTYSRRR